MHIQSFNIICKYLPQRIRMSVLQLPENSGIHINEIRIRSERPIAIHFSDRTCFLCHGGKLTDKYTNSDVLFAKSSEINEIFNALCKYSVHSCSRELTQGFFTIENGIRVGISGSIAKSDGGCYKYISGLNFRISREVSGCADEIFNRVFSSGLKSVLICGGVNSGKTTILRDLCKSCGDVYKITLVDERNEISASICGIPTNDVGIQTDIIEGCTRENGIISAIRTLSPQIIVCDELSGYPDSEAVMSGFGCGVKFIATVHADSFDDLSRRKFLQPLLSNTVFDYAVILEGSSMPGKIREIRRLKLNV